MSWCEMFLLIVTITVLIKILRDSYIENNKNKCQFFGCSDNVEVGNYCKTHKLLKEFKKWNSKEPKKLLRKNYKQSNKKRNKK